MKKQSSKNSTRFIASLLSLIIISTIFLFSAGISAYATSATKNYTYDEICSILAGDHILCNDISNEEITFNYTNFPTKSRLYLSDNYYYICSRYDGKMITHNNEILGTENYNASYSEVVSNPQLWYFVHITDEINCIKPSEESTKVLTVNSDNTLSFQECVVQNGNLSPSTNQQWTITVTGNGNKLIPLSSPDKAFYYTDTEFGVTENSSLISYFGFFDYSWWKPCASISANNATIVAGNYYRIQADFKTSNGDDSNLESQSPWVSYTLISSSNSTINIKENLVRTTWTDDSGTTQHSEASIHCVKITHRVTHVTETFYVTVNPLSQALGVTPIQQEKSQWCWAACAEMVGKYLYPSSTRTQKDISDEIKGTYIFGISKNEPGTVLEMAEGIEYVTYGTYSASGYPYAISATALCNELQNNRPIIVLWVNHNTGLAHSVVINYCILSGDSSNVNYTFYYIDPLDKSQKTCTYKQLTSTGIDGCLYRNTVLVN